MFARLLDTQQLRPPTPQPPKKRSYLSSSSSSFGEQNIEYARNMEQHQNHQQQEQEQPPQQQPQRASRLGLRNAAAGGVIVEVQGGHIVRSTGRKDRHSKVCTAKGPRDRRVRLSAHTAIQFYDVQDRLGYDRPSKAVDWLIKKAKASIDELAELPAWNPTATATTTATTTTTSNTAQQTTMAADRENASDFAIQLQRRHQQEQMESGAAPSNNNNNQSFLPPSLDSDAIADTIKSFFPMGASAGSSSNAMHFQNYPTDLLSRTSSHSQDLRLSLQSFQDPMLIQSHHHQAEQHALFSGNNQLGFDSSYQPSDIGRFQRMVAWNAGADSGNSGGFMFNSPPPQPPQPQQPFLQQLFGSQSQLFSQRGPLQSSNTPSIRAWIDPPQSIADQDHHHHHYQTPSIIHPSTISGIGGFASSEFSGFRIPARIQGEEDHDDGISNKPSSASSDSRH